MLFRRKFIVYSIYIIIEVVLKVSDLKVFEFKKLDGKEEVKESRIIIKDKISDF